MKKLLSLAVLVATWAACAQGTFEAIQSYVYNVSGSVTATAGWTFQTTTPLSATSLGCFADVFVNNATVNAIQVGLWAPSGFLMASNTVTPSSTLFDQTRYVSITPVLLNPGQLYHIGVFYGGGALGLDVPIPATGGSVSPAPEIQLGGTAIASSGFAFPAEVPGTGGSIYGGPNFRYQNGVPEPSTWLLLGLGGLLLNARWRTRWL
jgi:PEP-CTERM motif